MARDAISRFRAQYNHVLGSGSTSAFRDGIDVNFMGGATLCVEGSCDMHFSICVFHGLGIESEIDPVWGDAAALNIAD
jgi:hypothetical protein